MSPVFYLSYCCGTRDEYMLFALNATTRHKAAVEAVMLLSKQLGETWGWNGDGFVPDRSVSERLSKRALLLRSA